MKVIEYTLTIDGTIPDYVTDGGYFLNYTNVEFPQNFTVIGIANDEATEKAIATEADLLKIVSAYSPTIYDPITQKDETAEVVVAKWWDNHVNW